MCDGIKSTSWMCSTGLRAIQPFCHPEQCDTSVVIFFTHGFYESGGFPDDLRSDNDV